MKITLDTEQDVLNYISFLQKSNQLLSKVGTIELTQEEATAFLQSNVPSIKPTVRKSKWSADEDNILSTAIHENTTPEKIATKLSRTVASVRSRSINHLRIGYTNNKWHQLRSSK